MMQKVMLLVCFIAILAVINLLGAVVFGAVGYVAQLWIECFSALDDNIAGLGALVIGLGGFIFVLMAIVRVELWWRLRKIQHSQLSSR